MIKTILAVLIAAAPAGAAEFNLERTGLDAFNKEIAVPAAAAPERVQNRLSVSEINNRWIASIYVTGQRLSRLASNANGIAPHAMPPGLAVELGTLARRTLESAEKMHYAALDARWHVVSYEAEKLDRVAAGVMDWAAEAGAHHNAAALKAGELAAAGRDLASALSWLRADSGQLMGKGVTPAVMPVYEFDLDCRGEGMSLTGRLSRKGGQLRVASAALYQQLGGEGETLRFFPETGSAPERSAFLSSDSAFFNYTLDLPGSALARPSEFAADLKVSFDDESSTAFSLKCSTR